MSEPRDRQSLDPATLSGIDSITVIFNNGRDDQQKNAVWPRTLKLTPDNNKIAIGRASKTLSKQLIPASTNAFFDSPVISRQHAVLESDFDSGVVRIVDAGSLHGTTINKVRLTANDATVLTNGDKISFGAHVARGLEVYMPTMCKVEIVTHHHEAPPRVERARSYCAPESVYDSSDESSVAHETHTDEPSPISADDSSLLACDSPTLTAAKAVAEPSKPARPLYFDFYQNYSSEDDDISYEGDSGDEYSSEDEEESDLEEDEDGNEDGVPAVDEAEVSSKVQALNKSIAESLRDDPEADFLEKEIRQLMAKANIEGQLLDLKMQAKQNILGSSPVEQSTAPSMAPSMARPEDAQNDAMCKASATLDGGLVALSTAAARAAASVPENKKIDIPSILNPSPPYHFVKHADAGLAEYMQFSKDAKPTEATSVDAVNSLRSMPAQTNPLFYAAAEATVWQTPGPVQPAPVADVTPTPAAISHPWKEPVAEEEAAKTSTKRKIDTALAEDVELASLVVQAAFTQASESKVVPPTMPAPAAENSPAPKRQATSLSVSARSQVKSKAWAAVETLGIAAIGGAVVLGSLIYTAPTF